MGRPKAAALALILGLATPAGAEMATYGEVELTGLARDSWPLNAPGLSNAMVCNVNGPDGFLTVRAGPGEGFAKVRAFNRLAMLVVDTTQRRGHWIRVVDGFRNVNERGETQADKALPVSGWAHDGYLCDFLH